MNGIHLSEPAPNRSIPYAEFVTMMAFLSALGALATDAMLPALPTIGEGFAVDDPNRLQFIVTTFLMGSGLGQIAFGPLSDTFGRRRILLTGLALYAALSLVAAVSISLPMLFTARVLQGLASASTAVLSRAIIRDQYSGSQMAKVSSTIFIVFLAAPILAPSVGQAILIVAPWRAIFGFLALISGCMLAWVGFRLPETLPAERRHPLGLRPVVDAARYVLSQPAAILYWTAMMLLFGALLTYVATMPQVFNDVFHAPSRMATAFAAAAGLMGVGSFANVQIVERFGMHRISHTALLGLLVTSAVHVAVALWGHETILSFTLLQGLTMLFFGLCLSNFGAISMQPMGKVAGSAASLQGMAMGLGGALLGALCGSFWRGSIVLLPLAFLVLGAASLICVLVAERGRLFHNHFGAVRSH
jgi:DHA1 family bicyclomycin/chloramphenicol resistance-like MFS transporter